MQQSERNDLSPSFHGRLPKHTNHTNTNPCKSDLSLHSSSLREQ